MLGLELLNKQVNALQPLGQYLLLFIYFAYFSFQIRYQLSSAAFRWLCHTAAMAFLGDEISRADAQYARHRYKLINARLAAVIFP